MAIQVDDNSRNFAKTTIEGNIRITKKELEELLDKRPGAKKAIEAKQAELTKFISQKKAVDDAIKESNKPKLGDLKERDSVIKFAKNNDAFKEVKSGWNGEDNAKAFELKLGQLTFRADFLNSREFLYMFKNEDGDVLYDTDVVSAEEIDWDNLLNNTKNWLIDKQSKIKNNLKKVTLYDNTLKRYYHNNLFVYCLTFDLNICYICRDFVNYNNYR